MSKKIDYREIFFYLLSGVNTTFVNYTVYYICRLTFGIPIVPSNILAFIVSVCVAFIVNKVVVYRKLDFKLNVIAKEFTSFISLRIVSMVIDTGMLYILADLLGFNELYVKIAGSIVVTVLNYIFGKFITFRKD
ncbi:MAG: GtrA family protein [Erysipelotrichales bacterium]|nr:GtrA family protein [Erysipelotrichales bacterium]